MGWVRVLAWAWLIIIGAGIIITPGGPVYPGVSNAINMAIGVVAVVLGVAAFASHYMGRS
jgi:hypothetical protein